MTSGKKTRCASTSTVGKKQTEWVGTSSSEEQRESDVEQDRHLSSFDRNASKWAGEFDDPVDLTGIQADTAARMVAAAPMLLGRAAMYDDNFFKLHVGLCDEGPLLVDVPKVYPHITDNAIKAVWRVGSQPNRYEIVNCTSAEQIQQFRKQYYKVYGNRPDNGYFSLRFLKACYATFVNKQPVNWVAEARLRLKKRTQWKHRNPRKLGPIAMRAQVEGLCSIIKHLAASPATGNISHVATPSATGNKSNVDIAKATVKLCLAGVEAAAGNVDEAFRQFQLTNALSIANDENVEAEGWEAAYAAASKEARRLAREASSDGEYLAKATEARSFHDKLTDYREKEDAARRERCKLKSTLLEQRRKYDEALASLRDAEAAHREATQQDLILQPKHVFNYPASKSIPPLDMPGIQVCAYCNLGFVAKAAVLCSCGCFLHCACVAELLASKNYRCRRCKDVLLASSPIHVAPTWVAQFGGDLDDSARRECSVFATILKNIEEDNTDRLLQAANTPIIADDNQGKFTVVAPPS